ncbi:MAG: RNA polymerase sigma factor [Nannocystaceae bacterium]|nr:sigma-70 family RNA polymerase sigma factor [bacterium]
MVCSDVVIEDLRRWFAAHQRDYPISGFEFEAYLDGLTSLDTAPDETRSLDMYLVVGWRQGGEEAAKHLLARHQATIDGALRRLRLPAHRVDEVRSTFYEILFVGEVGTPALARYGGKGSLDGWLKVMVSRSASRLLRRTERLEFSEPESFMEVWHEPERDALNRECKQAFRTAMLDAIASFDAEERSALRDYYVGGLSIDALADIWGVHRATAARRLSRLRWAVRERVLDRLEAKLRVSPSSALRIARSAQSRLTADLGLLDED